MILVCGEKALQRKQITDKQMFTYNPDKLQFVYFCNRLLKKTETLKAPQFNLVTREFYKSKESGVIFVII
jgi:hypothetical protein